MLRRREIIQLFAAAASGFWARRLLPASAFRQAAAAGVLGNASPGIRPVSQARLLAEPLLPLFPLRLVLFPHANLALHIFEERYKEMIRDCLQNQWEFGILLAQGGSVEKIGCTASISEVLRRYADGRMDILVHGQRRFEVSLLNRDKSYLRGEAKFLEDDGSEAPSEKLRQQALQLYNRLIELLASDDPASKPPSHSLSEEQLSYRIMAELPAELSSKQRLLELRSEQDRLERVIRHLERLLDSLEKLPGQRPPGGTA
ncbi:MAG: LON peptidase substrate-binding domain-containing protein [Acidobacteria bacterium]|nr:LON peptidase substrate-binding domain-containing protein [Acidobacteriota bacterium]